jgi:hypothetical protein
MIDTSRLTHKQGKLGAQLRKQDEVLEERSVLLTVNFQLANLASMQEGFITRV